MSYLIEGLIKDIIFIANPRTGSSAIADAILAAGGDIHYSGAAGPQDFDANGDVAGYFSANVVKNGVWEGKIIK